MSDPGTTLFSAAATAVGEGSESLSSLRRLMDGATPGQFEEFLEHVDGSDYSLADWVEALVVFDSWLEHRNRMERPIGEMLGYIHCCTLMHTPGLSLPILKVIVNESLTEFGFEAISEPQM